MRRNEYLKAIKFYQQFAPVYFLENSVYDFSQDEEFAESKTLHIRKFPPSRVTDKGKGYQEFEMIDSWLQSECEKPKRWIKVTGRYIYMNFDKIINDINNQTQYSMIVDQFYKSKFSATGLFYVKSSFYMQHLMGLYQYCDDDKGEWIERVLYRNLLHLKDEKIRCFKEEPLLVATSGTTGKTYPNSNIKRLIKYILRHLNLPFNEKFLFFRNM